MPRHVRALGIVLLGMAVGPTTVLGQEPEGLAKQLANPIASLISVPFQGNFDTNIGPEEEGDRFYVNVQPVVPISLGADWNVISRTILPVIYQDDLFPGAGDQFGLGDTVQSLFFSPKAVGPHGIIWGVGPVLLLPTATDEMLGGEKWGAGPTGVALTQSGPWTIGALANHIWSIAGDDDRLDVNATFLQPFLAYTTPNAWTLTLNTEATYDWEAEEWSVPINGQVSKIVQIGTQPVSFFAGLRYWADSAPDGPEGLGARLGFTLLFPKR